ncbi:MAG: hypothetical protein M3O84_04005 [Actinomycetota bacterium]|nr:hypothetical protein [Actinomycetota bacterium]
MSLAVKMHEQSESSAPRWRLSMPQLWAFVAVALPVVASLGARLSAIDLAYQLRAGDAILATHSLPGVDSYTFTVGGRPWLDQQWGAQALLALFFRAGGWAGLVLLRAALVGAIFWLIYASCRAAGASLRRSAGLSIAAFAIASPGLNLRPQLFAMLLFALTGWLVAHRHAHPRWLLAVPVIVVLWTNLHGSFFLAPLLLGLAWLADRKGAPETARRSLLLAFVSLAATLIGPFGYRVWTYAYHLSSNPIVTRLVSEWQPPTIRNYGGAVFFISAAAVAALLARRTSSVPWPALLAIGVFFVIGLDAQRGISWWAYGVPPILAGVFPSAEASSSRGSDHRMLNSAIAVILVGIGVVLAPWWHSEKPPGGPDGSLRMAPPGITAELTRILKPGDRIFNPQIWGSWFEYRFPQSLVAVDARIEIFPADVWQKYTDVSAGSADWSSILDDWNVDVVVASRDQQSQLLPLIRSDPSWRLAYEDPDGAVFVRSTSTVAAP